MPARSGKTGPDSAARTPMDAALRYLGAKARTAREVERYLDEQQYGEYEIMQAVARLQELGYVDDAAYAREFVRTRLNTKPVSRRKLREQLLAHELPAEAIDSALASIDGEQEYARAQDVALKYLRQLSGYGRPELEQRLMQRLLGRGFSVEDSARAVRAALEEGGGDEPCGTIS